MATTLDALDDQGDSELHGWDHPVLRFLASAPKVITSPVIGAGYALELSMKVVMAPVNYVRARRFSDDFNGGWGD